jgi:gluconolactonase
MALDSMRHAPRSAWLSMNRRLSPLVLLPLSLFAACASKTSDAPPGEVQPVSDAGLLDDATDPLLDASVTPEPATNPIEGIAPAKLTLDTGAYTDGPVWSAKEGVLFFTTPLGQGALYRMQPDGTTIKVRDGDPLGAPIGNTIDKVGNLFTIEAKRIVKSGVAADAGAPTVLASGYDTGEAGIAAFDTLNDAVITANGTLYATDPGYFATPIANRIFRITAAGKVTALETFEDIPRPNGIALTPDGKGLYVGFSQPLEGTKPFIRKYLVQADGTLAVKGTFVELDKTMQPDGIEVDQAGNVFVATSAGIVVYQADATKLGVIAVPEPPTAMAFGGPDLKTLYITTAGTKIFQVTSKIAGIVQ